MPKYANDQRGVLFSHLYELSIFFVPVANFHMSVVTRFYSVAGIHDTSIAVRSLTSTTAGQSRSHVTHSTLLQ